MKRTAMLLTSMAAAMVLGGGTALAVLPGGAGAPEAGASERAKDPGTKLERSLDRLVATRGGPPGVVAVVQRGQNRDVYTSGVAPTCATGDPRK